MDLLTHRFHQALQLASELHADQARKGARSIPYIAHLLGVTARVLKAAGSEEQAIAALLHDAIEDQGHKISVEEITSRFGAKVAAIVVQCTDASAEEKLEMDWWERKRRYVSQLAAMDTAAMLVVLADKLENASDTLWDLDRIGHAVWSRFSNGAAGELWFYKEVQVEVERWALAHEPVSDDFSALLRELRRVTILLAAMPST